MSWHVNWEFDQIQDYVKTIWNMRYPRPNASFLLLLMTSISVLQDTFPVSLKSWLFKKYESQSSSWEKSDVTDENTVSGSPLSP